MSKATELLNQKLLLSPTSTFAVSWRLALVMQALLEIGRVVLKVRYHKRVDQDGMGNVLCDICLPTPVAKLDRCVRVDDRVRKDVIRNVWYMFHAQNHAESSRPLPWYCSSEYVILIQCLYSAVAKCLVYFVLTFAGSISFLDVYVNFFTGEFDSRGLLQPKPFFTRWVIPGLLLQLIGKCTIHVEIFSF